MIFCGHFTNCTHVPIISFFSQSLEFRQIFTLFSYVGLETFFKEEKYEMKLDFPVKIIMILRMPFICLH